MAQALAICLSPRSLSARFCIMFQLVRAGRLVPKSILVANVPVVSAATACRAFSSPALSTHSQQTGSKSVAIAPIVNSISIQKRHAGVSVLACAIAMVAVGGCAQGIGQLFAALVVGMARNPSMKEDLFTYTLIGMGFLEFLAIVVILIAGLLLYSE